MTEERKITKISVNLPDEIVAALREMALRRGTTVTEVLKAAIGTERFLSEKVESGAKVLLEEKDKSLKQLVFMHQKVG